MLMSKNIKIVKINDIKIYINKLNGCFWNEASMVENTKPIDIQMALDKTFDTTSHTFCLNISNSCNLNCDYCFNKEKIIL